MERKLFFCAFLLPVLILPLDAKATDTVLSVTQMSYTARGELECTAVRMNPSSFSALPSSACELGSAGSFGPDRITKSEYDAAGQLVLSKEAYGTPIQRTYSAYSYSLNGKVIDSIDSNGNRTRFSYDGFDRLSRVNYPSTVRASAFNGTSQASALSTANSHSSTDYETFSYDGNNNRTSWRRRNGFVINYQYDALNREFFKDVPVSPGNSNGTDKDVITYYNALGLPSYRYFGSGKYIYTGYDGFGRKNVQLDMNGNYQWFYYNKAGALWVHYYNSSSYIAYYRDAANRPYGVVNNLGQNIYSIAYNNLGRLSNINKGGVNIDTYSYDGVGRVTGIATDLSGTVGDVSYTFSYNPASQILSLTSNNTNYDYNEPSNSTQNRAFNGLNQDTGYTYDGNGNLTNNAGRTLTYDVENHLIAVSGPTNATFEYDPNGTLAKQVINGVETRFLYNDSELIGELDANNNILRRYVHGIGVDRPVVWYEGADYANKRYFVQNYQGSVIGYTDGNGTLLDTYKYTAFGEPKSTSNNEYWGGSRFRYTGQIALPEAKLFYYKARVYDPALGTFLQTDPIGTKDDMNMYAYVGGDPVNMTDPTGMAGKDDNAEKEKRKSLEDLLAKLERDRRELFEDLDKARSGIVESGKVVKDALEEAKGQFIFSIQTAAIGFSDGIETGATNVNSGDLLRSTYTMYQLRGDLPNNYRIIAGGTSGIAIRDVQRLSTFYGGEPGQWQKISSPHAKLPNGAIIEVHAYRNSATGRIVEEKLKLVRGPN